MVSSASNFSRSGLRDWWLQRLTAVVIGVYAIYLLIYVACHPHLSFVAWQWLFACVPMRVFSTLVLGSVLAHAWIGIWTVFTDYIKITWLRVILISALVLGLFAYVVWGLCIIW
jgi:succinate dehydrogenase / fumarate reductase membrane anchor subunit